MELSSPAETLRVFIPFVYIVSLIIISIRRKEAGDLVGLYEHLPRTGILAIQCLTLGAALLLWPLLSAHLFILSILTCRMGLTLLIHRIMHYQGFQFSLVHACLQECLNQIIPFITCTAVVGLTVISTILR